MEITAAGDGVGLGDVRSLGICPGTAEPLGRFLWLGCEMWDVSAPGRAPKVVAAVGDPYTTTSLAVDSAGTRLFEATNEIVWTPSNTSHWEGHLKMYAINR